MFDGFYIPIPEPEGRITEFMRWRLGTGADVPGHATYYRVFGGGWATVLAAYRDSGRGGVASHGQRAAAERRAAFWARLARYRGGAPGRA